MPRQPRTKAAASPVRSDPPYTRQQSRGTRSPVVKQEQSPDEVDEAPAEVEQPTRRFSCSICSRRFTSAGHLNRHERTTHDGTKQHPCPYPGCFTKCSRQDNLLQHYRIHLAPTYRRPSVRRRAKKKEGLDSDDDYEDIPESDPSAQRVVVQYNHNESPPNSPPPLVPMPNSRPPVTSGWAQPAPLIIPSAPQEPSFSQSSPVDYTQSPTSYASESQPHQQYMHQPSAEKNFYTDLGSNGHFHEEFPLLLCTDSHPQPHTSQDSHPQYSAYGYQQEFRDQIYQGMLMNPMAQSSESPMTPTAPDYFEHTPPPLSAHSSYSSLSGAITPRDSIGSAFEKPHASSSSSTQGPSSYQQLSTSYQMQPSYPSGSTSYPSPSSYPSPTSYEPSPTSYPASPALYEAPSSSSSQPISFVEPEWKYPVQQYQPATSYPMAPPSSTVTSIDVSFSSAIPEPVDSIHASESPSPVMDCLQKPTRHQREMKAFYEQRERDQAFERQIAIQRGQMQLEHEQRLLSDKLQREERHKAQLRFQHRQQIHQASLMYPGNGQAQNDMRTQQPGSYPLQLAPTPTVAQGGWNLGPAPNTSWSS